LEKSFLSWGEEEPTKMRTFHLETKNHFGVFWERKAPTEQESLFFSDERGKGKNALTAKRKTLHNRDSCTDPGEKKNS